MTSVFFEGGYCPTGEHDNIEKTRWFIFMTASIIILLRKWPVKRLSSKTIKSLRVEQLYATQKKRLSNLLDRRQLRNNLLERSALSDWGGLCALLRVAAYGKGALLPEGSKKLVYL